MDWIENIWFGPFARHPKTFITVQGGGGQKGPKLRSHYMDDLQGKSYLVVHFLGVRFTTAPRVKNAHIPKLLLLCADKVGKLLHSWLDVSPFEIENAFTSNLYRSFSLSLCSCGHVPSDYFSSNNT